MSNVPTNLIPTRISQLPEAPVADPAGYFPIVISGTTYKVQFSQIQGSVEVPASRRVDTGTGLTGGGSLSANLTIAVANGGIGNDQLDTTGVAAGTYGSGSAIPVVTVNNKGRVTNVSTEALVITGYVPDNRQVVAGAGLAGGGNLSADRTLSIAYSSTIPSALGSPSAGTVENPARADHVHPALNLSDSSQTSGVLMMGRGGTGSAMSPVAGAVVVSNGTNFDLTTVGSSGQVLISNGASLPSWGPAGSLVVDAASRLLGGSANQVIYQAGTDDTSFVIAPVSADTFLKWNGSSFEWDAVAGAGTVTSVDGSGGTTGLTVSGGPITSAGTLTLGGTLAISAGGTGLGTAPTNGKLLIGNGSGYTLATLTAGTAISVTNATGSITLANTAPDQTVTLTNGTAISVTGTYPSFTVTNTLPDQTVVLTQSGGVTITGTYPSFTISSTSSGGTVTSVDSSSTVSGFTLTGGPITGTGVITLAGTLAISNGGTGASTQADARTALGLGTIAVQDANSVNITGGNVSVGSANITTLTSTSGTITNLLATTASISGAAVISVNSSSNALRITQTGSGNALLVEDSANPDSSPFVVDSTGFVLAGYTANVDSAQIQTFNGSQTNFRWNAASTGPSSNFKKSRSPTVNSYSIVGNGDRLGTLRWFGDDGAAFVEAASVQTEVDGTPGTNDMPGRLVFSTTADGASSPTERLRIDSSGNVGIGKTASTKLDVSGTITGTNIIITGEYSGTISGGTY